MTDGAHDRTPVTKQALTQRINRKLKHQGEILTSRKGEYFVISDQNVLVLHHVNVEAFARQLGVMREWEYLHG